MLILVVEGKTGSKGVEIQIISNIFEYIDIQNLETTKVILSIDIMNKRNDLDHQGLLNSFQVIKKLTKYSK